MRADLHVHTRFSCDSQAEMEGYCRAAIQNGVDVVCFTEHIDYNPVDDGYGFYRAEAYFQSVERMQEKYVGQLKILCGLEFSEPHVYPKEFEHFQKLPYDFIIGSLHWVNDLFPSWAQKHNVSASCYYEDYWKEMQKMVEFGGFDAVGHLDFPKRYYGCLEYDSATVREILQTAVQNGLILEINTSSRRKGLSSMMPDDAMLKLYREVGGEVVTIGSDSHFVEDLAADFAEAEAKVQAMGLHRVIYQNRIQQRID